MKSRFSSNPSACNPSAPVAARWRWEFLLAHRPASLSYAVANYKDLVLNKVDGEEYLRLPSDLRKHVCGCSYTSTLTPIHLHAPHTLQRWLNRQRFLLPNLNITSWVWFLGPTWYMNICKHPNVTTTKTFLVIQQADAVVQSSAPLLYLTWTPFSSQGQVYKWMKISMSLKNNFTSTC